jgi:hypothetical protein
MKAISITLLVGAMAAAAACSSSSTSPSASIAGTYVLSSVNGESLPAIVTKTGDDTAVVVADTLALTANNTYTRHAVDTLRSEVSGVTLYSHVSSGTYARSGSSITLTDAVTDSSATGTIANNAITISSVENGFAVTGVFTKQ